MQTLAFAGGGTMSLEGLALTMPAGSSVLNGTSAGNDTLIATAGSEYLSGEGFGNDTFVGIAVPKFSTVTTMATMSLSLDRGVQRQMADTATTTYSYVAGDGTLTISDNGGTNTLLLGPEGLGSSQLTLHRIG